MKSEDPTQKVYISHTNREWKTIEKRMKEIGRKDLSSYITGRISILKKQYSGDPAIVCTSIERKKQKPLFLKKSSLSVIAVISLRTGVPVSTIIDRLIIDPLIMPLD